MPVNSCNILLCFLFRVNLVPLQYIVKECVDATDADTAQSLQSLSEELPGAGQLKNSYKHAIYLAINKRPSNATFLNFKDFEN